MKKSVAARTRGTKSTPAIDLMSPKAREALLKVHPKVVHAESTLPAGPVAEEAARLYLRARDEAKMAEGAKDLAGNVLAAAIGDHEAVEGETWRATWADRRGSVDYEKLVRDLGVPESTLDRYRRPAGRTLTVTAKGE